MTIAIGMLCEGGAVVTADTKVTLSDGSVTQGEKIEAFVTTFGSMAIANSSNDANAAKTLIRKLRLAIEKSPIKTWTDLEDSIAYEMTGWAAAFREHPPTSFVIVACIKGLGVELYFCEPPNTVLPKPEGYVAAGGGSAVTDPLQKTLFESYFSKYQDPQSQMRQLAYLMYRAKKDHALCGGKTSAVYVRQDGEPPEWVRQVDFVTAENHASQLDFLLQAAARFALFSKEGSLLEVNANALADLLKALSGIRRVEFRNRVGELIDPLPRAN